MRNVAMGFVFRIPAPGELAAFAMRRFAVIFRVLI
jgi:hypothetical protein